MHISIILSTYNNPEWLKKVLWGYENQTYSDFDIVIADDGSDNETKSFIENYSTSSKLEIQHYWHPDNGFQKCKILNIATMEARGEYLIFTDGDCIPLPDFVETHAQHAEPKYFISGGYCKLPMELSKRINREDIDTGRAFNAKWLKQQGLKSFSSRLKLACSPPWDKLADTLTTTKPSWNGCNASTWKAAILEVNGHNETMQYGGEDREMGERLLNLGFTSKQLRHRALLIHLDHARGYIDQEQLNKNMAIRQQTVQDKITWSPDGILKQDQRP
ncbi:glycosyltransferase family 2 protein [Rubritalea sp.]|uniref:glycosyltransferase family 2 protein n=1 Tax=Rubritalea sp. TaxID=2109375 RepID=UPI003EF27278